MSPFPTDEVSPELSPELSPSPSQGNTASLDQDGSKHGRRTFEIVKEDLYGTLSDPELNYVCRNP